MQLLLLYHKPGEEEKIPQGLAGNMKRGLRKPGSGRKSQARAHLASPSSSARVHWDTRLFFAQDGENLFQPRVSVPGLSRLSQERRNQASPCSTDAMAVTSRLCAARSADPSLSGSQPSHKCLLNSICPR